jgi:sarcosine oxidase delta subunit
MENAIIRNYTIEVKIDWTCPHCGHQQTEKFTGSAYSSQSEDPTDTQCDNCKDFVTLQL